MPSQEDEDNEKRTCGYSTGYDNIPAFLSNACGYYDFRKRRRSGKLLYTMIVFCVALNTALFLRHFPDLRRKPEKNAATERILMQTENSSDTTNMETIEKTDTAEIKPEKTNEQQFIDLVESYKKKAPDVAKNLVRSFKPSQNRPFIFFHQRKAGGSTFRQFLYDAAQQLKLSNWIPSCRFGGIPCAVIALPTHAKFSVYGGHFRYVEADKNYIIKNIATQLTKDKESGFPPFTCLVTARPTIDRVTSCWNYRFIQELRMEGKLPHSSNMTAELWDEHLPQAYSKFNEGCNNEFVRNFGNTQDETAINTMRPLNDPVLNMIALQELETVLKRLSTCVVTLLPQCEEGAAVIEHYLPWLQRTENYNCGTRINAGKVSTNKSTSGLDPESERAILKHNFLDELVYDYVKTLFEEQYMVATSLKKKNSGDANESNGKRKETLGNTGKK